MGMLNEAKYRNAILYFAEHVRRIGKVKLWKMLYYLDFDFYEQFQRSVTGEQYLHWENGPVPASGKAILDRMIADGEIATFEEPTGLQYPLMRIEPRRLYDLNVFTESEREMLEKIAIKWRHHSGREMIAATHGDIPWQRTARDNVIDYALALHRQDGVDPEEISEPGAGDAQMDAIAQTDLARQQSLAYAEYIERLWDTDAKVRARIERGLQQAATGLLVEVDIDTVIAQRREGTDPSGFA